jgi:hypothetical protein
MKFVSRSITTASFISRCTSRAVEQCVCGRMMTIGQGGTREKQSGALNVLCRILPGTTVENNVSSRSGYPHVGLHFYCMSVVHECSSFVRWLTFKQCNVHTDIGIQENTKQQHKHRTHELPAPIWYAHNLLIKELYNSFENGVVLLMFNSLSPELFVARKKISQKIAAFD